MGLFGKKKEADIAAEGGEVELNGTVYAVARVVDCLGDSCPRPQLKTKKAMAEAASGQVIEVRIDNPTSMEAIAPMMPEAKGTFLGTVKTDRFWRVIVQRN